MHVIPLCPPLLRVDTEVVELNARLDVGLVPDVETLDVGETLDVETNVGFDPETLDSVDPTMFKFGATLAVAVSKGQDLVIYV